MKHLSGAQDERNQKAVFRIKAACGSGNLCGLYIKTKGEIRMHESSLTHLTASNFCGIKHIDTDLWQKTLISGRNRAGKSTILLAILWLFTDKTADNSAAGDSIRPHDTNGIREDHTDITVSATVKTESGEYILTKTQRQRWVKKRGCEDREFQGNENLYEISGVPKSAKEFQNFIDENICPVDDLPFCINANTFLSLDTKKRRAKLLSLAKSFTDDDVIATNPAFEELRNDLKIGSLEELMKRSKNQISMLKKEQQEIPVRVDELNSQIVNYDFSALELEKNSLNEQLAEIDKQESEVQTIREQISNAKVELSEIKNSLNSSANEKRHTLELKLSEMKANLRVADDDFTRYVGELEKAKTVAANSEKAIGEAKNQQELITKEVFNSSSLICPKCKQPYPAEMESKMRAEFEQNRADEMNRLNDYIESLTGGKAQAEAKVKALESKMAEIEGVKAALNKDIADAENTLVNTTLVDVTQDAIYKAKMDEITALESKVANSTPTANKLEIRQNIALIEGQLARADANNQIEERIGELRDKLKEVGANILEQERLLYLLEEYNKAKIGMVEDSVNKYFGLIKFRFFEQQINGGYQEVCRATINGTDYDGLLNKSDRLLCQADLVKGFQDAANVELPIMMDDCESIDNERIPIYKNQMILLRREDCELTVSEIK